MTFMLWTAEDGAFVHLAVVSRVASVLYDIIRGTCLNAIVDYGIVYGSVGVTRKIAHGLALSARDG